MNIELLEQKINECKKFKIEDVNINEINNIIDFDIDTQKTSIERIIDFLEISKNPYIFKVDNIIVKIEFKNNSYIKAENAVNNVFKRMYVNLK